MPVLTSVTVSGTPMAIGDASIAAALGYAVVFVGLVSLMFVIILVGKVMVAKEKKAKAASTVSAQAAAPEVPAAAEAPGTAGELKLYDTDPKDAAMIMAIVAHRLGKPLNELRFKSIKEVK